MEGREASDKPIDSAVLSRMKQSMALNKLKKLAVKVNILEKLRVQLSKLYKRVLTWFRSCLFS